MHENIFYTPLGNSFFQSFIDGFLARYTTPEQITNKIILLPTNRACSLLKKAFRERTTNVPVNIPLPQIYAISDTDQVFLALGEAYFDPPKTISTFKRIALLSQLLQKFHNYHIQQSITLAFSLADFIDELWTSNIDPKNFDQEQFHEFADHWKLTFEFLELILHHWPKILADLGCVEDSKRRHEDIIKLANFIQSNELSYEFIIAGTTGTVPATRHLIQTILQQQKGVLILPGFNAETLHETTPKLTHPLYTQWELLKFLGIHNDDLNKIQPWPKTQETIGFPIHALYQTPIEANHNVAHYPKMIACRTPHEEARTIATIIQQRLHENADARITVITANLNLTKQITQSLKRFGIQANTSQGIALKDTVVGGFFCLISQYLHQNTDHNLLKLLKHPLCGKFDRKTHLSVVRGLEIHNLRNPYETRPLFSNLEQYNDEQKKHFEFLQNQLINVSHTNNFREYIRKLEVLAIALCNPDENRLFIEQDGIKTKAFLENLQESAGDFRDVKPHHFNHLFTHMIQYAEGVRNEKTLQDRVMILGTLEARLTEADTVIMAGLNEQSWPPAIDVGCWLSPNMREKVGLPPLERRIGLSSLDFYSGFVCDDIVLTRAKTDQGTPTIPSRLWERTTTFIKLNQALSNASPLKNDMIQNPPFIDYANAIFNGQMGSIGIKAPYPKPVQKLRPIKYSASDIERLNRNPYHIFAKRILALQPLNDFSDGIPVNIKGNILHKILELFIIRNTPKNVSHLYQLIDEVTTTFLKQQQIDDFHAKTYADSFKNIAPWICAQFKDIASLEMFAEIKLSKKIEIHRNEIEIFGIVDRYDRCQNDQIHITDYKTGTLPTKNSIENGLSPQLGILGWLSDQDDAGLQFWQLKAPEKNCVVRFVNNLDFKAFGENVQNLIQQFLNQDTPYLVNPDPKNASAYDPYKHLSREQEWRYR